MPTGARARPGRSQWHRERIEPAWGGGFPHL